MTPRGRPGWARGALAGAVVAVGVLTSPVVAPAAPAAVAAAGAASACVEPDSAFTPAALAIPGVAERSKVLALGRDRNGVPRTPPLTNRGRWQLGWDRDSGIRPGSRNGVVRLTAHTYPRDGSYGMALGNRLLARLRTGDPMVMSGRDGQRQCYKVVKQVKVRAGQRVPSYYTSGGRPLLAILVCSGVRRGPGDWSHRTIWFAKPVVG